MYVPMYFVILPFLQKCQDFLTRGGAILLKGTSVHTYSNRRLSGHCVCTVYTCKLVQITYKEEPALNVEVYVYRCTTP